MEHSARQARAARFKREAAKPPPPLPKNRMAHPGGKIVTSDKDKALAALMARKAAAGTTLTEAQRRAFAELNPKYMNRASTGGFIQRDIEDDWVLVVDPGAEQTATKSGAKAMELSAAISPPLEAAPVLAPGPSDDLWKKKRALRKKLHDIEVLEKRVEDGAVLQTNQKEKILQKAALQSELHALDTILL